MSRHRVDRARDFAQVRLERGLPGQAGFELPENDVVDQGALARSGHAGNRHQRTERNVDVDIGQVVESGAGNTQLATVDGTPPAGNADPFGAVQVLAGQRVDGRRRRPRMDQAAALFSGCRSQFDHVVAAPNRFEVVFDDHDGVAGITEPFQDREQAIGVPRMETDRRFVEDIERVDQAGAQGIGQGNPLRFAAREGPRLPVERQVAEPHLGEVLDASHEFGEHILRNPAIGVRQFESGEPASQVAQR